LIKEVTVTTSRSGARRRIRVGVALFVAAAALAAVSACSSGLITQTSNQVAAVPGANAYAGPNGEVALLGVMIAYSGPQGYPIGSNAPLIVRIFNNGRTAVRLVGASAAGAARVEKVTDNAAPPAQQTPEPTASAEASADPSASPSADSSGSPAPSAEPTQPPATGGASLDVQVPPSEYKLLVPGTGAYLQLTDLTAALTPGATVRVTFELEIGTEKATVEMVVPVAPPETPVQRASADVAEHE
jgi:copper(I)-binding protein